MSTANQEVTTDVQKAQNQSNAAFGLSKYARTSSRGSGASFDIKFA